MKPDKKQTWNEVLESVRVSVSPAIFSTWLSQTHLVSLRKLDERRYLAEIGCSSAFIKSTIELRYFGLIQDCLMKTLESPVDLSFVVKSSPDVINLNEALAPLFMKTEDTEIINEKIAKANIRPGFKFQNFAVSGSNQMAHAAAEAVAQKPGQAYNPLFIWGGVGVGKTHLMHAVGYEMIKQDIEAKVIACTGEDFTNDIVEGIRNKTTQKFRDKYRKLKALLIDDIQFIAGKDAVQDEFFHTFNAVTAAGGQIILTSDKPPSAIAKLEERLRSRFEAGLIVDIGLPDFELRCAIVQIKANEKKLEIPVELVHMIAGNISTARQLEGFLVRLSSETKIRNVNVNEDVIQSILGKGIDGEEKKKPQVAPDRVIDTVCTYYNMSRRAMFGKARARMVARPRMILMYLLRTELNLPLEEIGNLIGGRDHTTAIHAVDRITNLATTNVNIREDILKIKNSL